MDQVALATPLHQSLQSSNYSAGTSTSDEFTTPMLASSHVQWPTPNQTMPTPNQTLGYLWNPQNQQPMYNYPLPAIQPQLVGCYYPPSQTTPNSSLSLVPESHSISQPNYGMVHASHIPVGFNTHQRFGPKVESTDPSDQTWIKDWLSRRQIKCKQKETANSEDRITLSEAKQQLKKAFNLLNQLSEIKQSLRQIMNEDEYVWKTEMQKLQPVQEELMKIMTVFSKQKIVEQLKKRITSIKKKREQMRKQCAIQKQEALKKEKVRLERENALQTWKDQVREKLRQDKMEKQMKAEADAILAEVRKKISEAKKTRERIRLLEKLRHVKKGAVQQKAGLFSSIESDKIFAEKIASLKQLIQNQLNIYEAEEKALEVMLETEQEDQKEQEIAQKQKKLQDVVEQRKADVMEGLFGSKASATQHDPLYYFWQYHTQGERNLESLIQIRHEWDMYLVPSHNPEGSSIPLKWIVPEQPSSAMWASVLQDYPERK